MFGICYGNIWFENEKIFLIVFFYLGRRFRNLSGVILAAVWAAAQIFFSPIAFFVTDWRYLISAIIGLPLLVSNIFTIFFLDESPRYLVAQHDYERARKVLNKIAVYNLRPPFKFRLFEEMDEYSSLATSWTQRGVTSNKYFFLIKGVIFLSKLKKRRGQNISDDLYNFNFLFRFAEYKINEKEKKLKFKLFYGYIDLFRTKKFRCITIMMCYIWFFRYYMYYGIQFSLEDLGTELHINVFFVALGEMIAAIIGGKFNKDIIALYCKPRLN